MVALFASSHLSCARDLFNLYCNTASQSSYTEIMPRLQWVRLLREAEMLDGRLLLTPADGDIIFNKVLAGAQQASHTGAHAFAHGRTFTFHVFLLGLIEVASKAHPNRAITAALREVFAQNLEPLLARKIAALQIAQQGVELPLGAGINSSGVSGGAAGPGNWGANWNGGAGRGSNTIDGGEEKQDDAASTAGSVASSSSALYPNHPSSSLVDQDAAMLLSSDADVRGLFATYHKVLMKSFHAASWEGVEAVHGVSIPRLNSALLVHSSPATLATNQRTWDQFLQSKQLLSEHAFRRWVSLHNIVPDLLTHKLLTMLFREGNIGFDRAQDQFVLSWQEFKETLLRIALLAFCSTVSAHAICTLRQPSTLFESMRLGCSLIRCCV